MGAPKKADWREERRRPAWELAQQEWSQRKIAKALGVSEGAVSQWFKKARHGGVEALAAHPPPGSPSRLTAEQLHQLPTILTLGAETFGFRGDVWTARRIAQVIWQLYGVRYHRDSVSRLLRHSGWSRQQPVTHATQRDDAAVLVWHTERWPALKKTLDEQRTIVWIDESSFYLLPMAVQTWAPKGCTPTLSVPLTRDHLSAISGITLDGRLFLQVRQQTYDSQGVVGFLRVLLRKIRGKLLIIWDGSPIHRSKAIKTFLAQGAAKRIHLERIPAYAPDCNPDEGVWNYLKRVELANVCCRDLAELEHEVLKARERLRHKRAIIRACSAHIGYI